LKYLEKIRITEKLKPSPTLYDRLTHLNGAEPSYVSKQPTAKILLQRARAPNKMPTMPPGQVTAGPKPLPPPWFSALLHIPHALICCIAFALRRTRVSPSHNSTIITCLCSSPCRPPLLLALPHHTVAIDEPRRHLLKRVQSNHEPLGQRPPEVADCQEPNATRSIGHEGVTSALRLRPQPTPTATTPMFARAPASFLNHEPSTPSIRRPPSPLFPTGQSTPPWKALLR
jgi:hypothetical protein